MQPGVWQKEINVRNFIQKNYTLYTGDDSFLQPPTEKTKKVWGRCEELLRQEMANGGVLDVETHDHFRHRQLCPRLYRSGKRGRSSGLQTDAPLKRIVNLYGGMRMAKSSLEQYGYQLDPDIEAHFSEYRKTHNEGVFDAYPKRTRVARHAGLLTGLPDAYGRGRIIGDYRRVALYGIDSLIEEKTEGSGCAGRPHDRGAASAQREEVSDADPRAGGAQGRWLLNYGCGPFPPGGRTPARPSSACISAIWPASRKTTAPPRRLGRTSTFLDIYIQRDLDSGRSHRRQERRN